MPITNNVTGWLQRIRGEFDAMPDRRVTLNAAMAIWDVEPHLLQCMLDALVDSGFLRSVGDGAYARRRLHDLGGRA